MASTSNTTGPVTLDSYLAARDETIKLLQKRDQAAKDIEASKRRFDRLVADYAASEAKTLAMKAELDGKTPAKK